MNSMMFILLLKKTQILFKLPKNPNPSVKDKGDQATNSVRLNVLLQLNATWSMPNLFKLEQTCSRNIYGLA